MQGPQPARAAWADIAGKSEYNMVHPTDIQPRGQINEKLANKQEIVDENLKSLNIEDYDFQDEFKNILFQNHIYGCAMMINKALTDKLLCLSNIAMHDHGEALIAVLEGKIIHVRKKLVKYRQHANNVTGGINQFSYKRKILHWNEVNRNQMKTFQMCRKICDLYKDKSNVAKMYLSMLDSNKYMRVVRAIKYGFRRKIVRK